MQKLIQCGLIACALLCPLRSWAAFQSLTPAPPPPSPHATETKGEKTGDAGCAGSGDKAADLMPNAKTRAVGDMVQLGTLPADKVTTVEKVQIPPATAPMETCK